MGSHASTLKQGRFAKPSVPHNLCLCTFRSTGAVGDERNCSFECPFFGKFRAQAVDLYVSSSGAIPAFAGHNDRKAVIALQPAFNWLRPKH